MIIELIIALLIGTALGIITGLTPGVHINLVSAILLASLPFLLRFLNPLSISLIIVGMTITHTFLDFIPSTYLGAPDSEIVLSVLPAHRMLKEGQAFNAVKLSTIGTLAGLILTIVSAPLLIYLAAEYYSLLQPYIPYLLILSLLFLVYKETGSRIKALFIIILAATLGIIVLNFPNIKEPLFPLLSGLFGTSTLLVSLKDKTKIPLQDTKTKLELDKKQSILSTLAGFVTSSVAGFMPGISSSQVGIIASSFFKKLESKYFIMMIGAIGMVMTIISFNALYAINKGRNGAVVVISKILQEITLEQLMIFLAASLFIGGIATILSLKLAKIFSKLITKVNYQHLCVFIISFLIILVLTISSWTGLLVLITSTAIGVLTHQLGTGKNHLMACLIVPVIFYFLL